MVNLHPTRVLKRYVYFGIKGIFDTKFFSPNLMGEYVSHIEKTLEKLRTEF